jgi:hypothetical protein
MLYMLRTQTADLGPHNIRGPRGSISNTEPIIPHDDLRSKDKCRINIRNFIATLGLHWKSIEFWIFIAIRFLWSLFLEQGSCFLSGSALLSMLATKFCLQGDDISNEHRRHPLLRAPYSSFILFHRVRGLISDGPTWEPQVDPEKLRVQDQALWLTHWLHLDSKPHTDSELHSHGHGKYCKGGVHSSAMHLQMLPLCQLPCKQDQRQSKGKVVTVLQLSTTSWRRIGEWRYSFTHSWPRHWGEVSGQLHAPAGLSLGKEPPVLNG